MEFKAIEIAQFLKGEIVGDGEVKVSRVSKIEEGMPGTLCFLANPKYENFLYTTNASVVLVNRNIEPKQEVKSTLIKVDNAYEAFAGLLELYLKTKESHKTGIETPSFIDPTSKLGSNVYIGAFTYVAKNAEIGDNSKIYPRVYVGDNVKIGKNCTIYPGVTIYEECVIGNNCIIHGGAVIGSDGFGFAPNSDGGYKKIPQIGNVVIEDNIEIGANTTIDRGTMGSTYIRKGVKLDNLIQIAHNCEIDENTVIAAQTGMAGSTKVGKNCRIGGQVGFSGHLSVGDNVQIGAQAGVSKSFKDNEVLWATPAFNHTDALKSAVVYRKLPKLQDEIYHLQKELEILKEKLKGS